MCRPLTEFGGLYVTHMRNEDDAIADAMEEMFAGEGAVAVALRTCRIVGAMRSFVSFPVGLAALVGGEDLRELDGRRSAATPRGRRDGDAYE